MSETKDNAHKIVCLNCGAVKNGLDLYHHNFDEQEPIVVDCDNCNKPITICRFGVVGFFMHIPSKVLGDTKQDSD